VSSQTRTRASEEERRLNMRTLAIASIASATAAVVTSQFWVAGTWMAAAVTPVLVTLISEMLHRPTAVIAERFTTEGPAIRRRRGERPRPERVGDAEPPVRVYRAGEDVPRPVRGGRSRKRIAIGVVAITAALAFAITAIAMTGTELVTGGSIGKGDRDTTLFGGDQSTSTEQQEQTTPESQGQQQDQDQQTEKQQTTTEKGGETTPEEQPAPGQTSPRQVPQVPTTPQQGQP
jgi:hypothetical protein